MGNYLMRIVANKRKRSGVSEEGKTSHLENISTTKKYMGLVLFA